MTNEGPRRRIGVVGDPEGTRFGVLLEALAQLFPVEFPQVSANAAGGVDGLLVTTGDTAIGLAAAASGVPAYVAGVGDGRPGPPRAAGTIRFAESKHLEACLRGQAMAEAETPLGCVPEAAEVLATGDRGAVWIRRPEGNGFCYLVGAALPSLVPGGFLFGILNRQRFMGLLPLLHFLREVTQGIDWDGPPPQACLVIDDPSFYWPSYGHLRFENLARHAAQFGYAVSLGAIPLDTWWVNRRVAALLRAAAPRISVVVHGNDHTTEEMLSPRTKAIRLAAAAQALRRMERLPRRHGIPYAKIMEAPHGALADDVFPHLLALGYDGVLCTPELLVRHNPAGVWPPTLGMHPAEFLGGGMPVLPRIKMTPLWRNDVLLAAFLRQPIVVVGHQADAAEGMSLFRDIAQTVRRVEDATWSDLSRLLRANYRHRVLGDVLAVRLYSRSVTVDIPAGIRYLEVDRPWVTAERTEQLSVRLDGRPPTLLEANRTIVRIAVDGAARVDLTAIVSQRIRFEDVPPPPPNRWAVGRKILMEFRDRLSTVLPPLDQLRRRDTNGRP